MFEAESRFHEHQPEASETRNGIHQSLCHRHTATADARIEQCTEIEIPFSGELVIPSPNGHASVFPA